MVSGALMRARSGRLELLRAVIPLPRARDLAGGGIVHQRPIATLVQDRKSMTHHHTGAGLVAVAGHLQQAASPPGRVPIGRSAPLRARTSDPPEAEPRAGPACTPAMELASATTAMRLTEC
jgi:hypothetical protein